MLVTCVLISQVDVGDSFHHVGANIYILVTCFVTNIEKLSPTDFVPNIRHQHRCSPPQTFPFLQKKRTKLQKNIPSSLFCCHGSGTKFSLIDFGMSVPSSNSRLECW